MADMVRVDTCPLEQRIRREVPRTTHGNFSWAGETMRGTVIRREPWGIVVRLDGGRNAILRPDLLVERIWA